MHLQAVVIHSIVDKWDYFFVLTPIIVFMCFIILQLSVFVNKFLFTVPDDWNIIYIRRFYYDH